MKANKRATGFKYIYETADPNVAVVRFRGEGVAGLVGLSRLEWVITRGDPNSIAQCCAELVTRAPLWAVENGTVEAAQEEVHRWDNPILYEAMDPG